MGCMPSKAKLCPEDKNIGGCERSSFYGAYHVNDEVEMVDANPKPAFVDMSLFDCYDPNPSGTTLCKGPANSKA